MMMTRYESFIGIQVRDSRKNIMGSLTDVNTDESVVWGCIDESYEVQLAGAVEVMNLIDGSHYLRLNN